MKSSEQLVVHLREVIQHIYSRPDMYAQTPDALNAVLYQEHRILAWVMERDVEMVMAYAQLAQEFYHWTADPPEWYYTPYTWPDMTPFATTVSLWKKVDEQFGLDAARRSH